MNNENPEIIIKNNRGEKEMELIRHCDNCDEQFDFNNVKKRFPPTGQEQLKQIWVNPGVEFYCTSCYFLKLIGHLKENITNRGDSREVLE